MNRDEVMRALKTGTGIRAALDAARLLDGDRELLELSFRIAEDHSPPWVDEALTRYWAQTLRQHGMAPAFAARVVNVLEEDPVGRAPELLAATALETRRTHHPEGIRRVMGAKWPRVLVVLGRLVGEVEDRGWSRRIEDAFRNCLAWQRSWPLRAEHAKSLRGVLIRAMRVNICPSTVVPSPLDRDPVGCVVLLAEALRASVRRPDRRWEAFIRVSASLVLTATPLMRGEIAWVLANEDPSLLRSSTSETALAVLYRGDSAGPGQKRLRDFLLRMTEPSDAELAAAEQAANVGAVTDDQDEAEWYRDVDQGR